ncbi:MAG: AraC family transcriptional regulator [Defluviitaleaceae bacterium]|nr:AraC family transcriptional regulator [Defluviitaleaceae bacterium]
MNWINDTQNAINFIEKNLLEDINADDVSTHIHSSTDYFQRTFNIVTGISISEYIRNRRLTLAGEELKNSPHVKVIDISMKYGYDSPDSFTKAFTRFHGVTPASARVLRKNLKIFYPLSIKVYIKGGFGMKRKVIPNIPEIDNYGNEVDYFLNLLEAAFTGTGEETNKAEIAAYSGMGNRFCWTDGKWIHGNEAMESIDETPFENHIRLMKAMGWNAKYISVLRDNDGKPLNTDNEQIKGDFVDAIDRGYPVLVRYVNDHKFNVIIGYEDDGSKIISKDAMETIAVHTTSETVVRENWEDSVLEYILLKEKTKPTSERERILDLFKMITSRARRTDEINGIKIGFAAWESYLHMLEHDDFETLPLLGEETDSVQDRFFCYCDGLCQVYARKEPLPHYRNLSERYPEWRDELNTAIAALDICADYGGFLWSQGFAINETGFEKFRDPAARKILADEGRKAMQKDIEAIEQFEKILQKEGA